MRSDINQRTFLQFPPRMLVRPSCSQEPSNFGLGFYRGESKHFSSNGSWAKRESNPRRADLQSAALPTELSARTMELRGIEPRSEITTHYKSFYALDSKMSAWINKSFHQSVYENSDKLIIRRPNGQELYVSSSSRVTNCITRTELYDFRFAVYIYFERIRRVSTSRELVTFTTPSIPFQPLIYDDNIYSSR